MSVDKATEPKAVTCKIAVLTLNPAFTVFLGTVGKGRAHEDESVNKRASPS